MAGTRGIRHDSFDADACGCKGHASDAADRLASELYEIRPELRVRECAVLVTDDDGEEVHRAPIVKIH
jgi:hypothetical protein